MSWQFQINVGHKDPPNWVSVGPTGKEPYNYDTEEEAQYMLELCYPDQCREDRLGGHPKWGRVVEVKDGDVHQEGA